MQQLDTVDPSASTRDLIRILRTQPDMAARRQQAPTGDVLPESVLWQTFCELRKRGEDRATPHFLRSVRTLHRRRSLGSVDLPTQDPAPVEHKLVDDPMLAELWKAYKRCICSQRTGPAGQLLRDIEARLETA